MSHKNNRANRVLAALLTVLMIATMVPASVVTAFALPNETAYNFTVKDVDDNPIEDATFTFDVDGIDGVKTDANGKASVSLPENTECKYAIEKIGYKKVEDTINVETATEIDIQLETLATLTVEGVVCDDEDQPLENVEIAVTGYCEYDTKTNDKGEFSITNVYADQEYTLTATLDGYKKVSKKLVLDASNEITLSLKEKIADFGFENEKETFKYTTDVISGIVAKSETYTDAVVKYSSSDNTIATVDENTGDITLVSVGEVVITATVLESDEYLETTATVTVEIKKGTQPDVEWLNSVPNDLSWKDSFTNVLSGGNDGTVKYSSDDENVAKVDSATGKVTFLKPGEVKITGVMDGGELYENISASYTIKVGKAEQDELVFEEKYPDAIFYGDLFENAAIGGSIEDKIEYKSSDDSIASVDENGAITTHKSGVVEITATIAGNELYETVSSLYELTIYKAEQKAEFLFVKGDSDKEIAYGEEFENAAMGGENSPITYSSSDDEVASVDSNGKITTHKAGTVTITATNPEDERFNKKEISYKLTVTRAEQTVDFENSIVPAITYGENYENKAIAKTEIVYSSSDESIVKVNAKTGKLDILKAGTVEITAKAKKTDQYQEASAAYTLTINKAEQVISFNLGANPETTFNVNDNNFVNTATTNAILAGETDISCVYSVVKGSEFVDGEINKTTGEFKIKGAGIIVVNVAFDSNDRYNLATSAYTLVVNKAKQTISFPEETYTTFSEYLFNINQPVATAKGKYGDGKITYSVKADPEAIISEVDASTGKISFTRNAGTATILATKTADDNYESATAEYSVTYKLISVQNPEDYYTLSGDVIDSDSGWFTGNVSVVAKDGYQLSYEKNRKDAKWMDELSDAVTEDGENKVTFYAKNIEKDSITNAITVTIKKDAVAPEATLELEEISVWDKFLTFIKNGKNDKEKAFYEAYASDDTSKVAEIVYYVDYTTTEVMSKTALDTLDENVWTTNEPIAQDSKCVVYSRVTDNAGNYVYVSSNGIVFDATKPAAEITLSSTAAGTDIYTKDVEVTIDVTDAQPSSGIKEVTYKTYSSDELVYNKTIVFTEKDNPAFDELTNSEKINFTLEAKKHNSDKVKIEVSVVDNSGNEYSTTKTLKVSANEPEISVEYQALEPQGTGADGVVYYNESREAYVIIKCRTSIFDKVAATNGIVVTAKDAKGNDIDGNFTIGKWVTVEGATPDEATHTATVTFSENARYNFTVDYTDNALTSAKQYKSNIFAIDKDAPIGTVTIDGNVWTVLLEKLTFGLWGNETVSVTATADDVTGEIKKIEYYKSNEDEIITLDDLNALDESAWTEYIEFTIPSDEQFTVYFRITDYSNNVTYICSDGYIVDKTSSNIILEYADSDVNGYHEEDLDVTISVNDKMENNSYYSGIQKVEYWVTADGKETQREVLYSYEYVRDEAVNSNGGTLTIKEKGKADIVKEGTVPTKADLKLEFSKDIVIDAESNNSDSVKLYVEVTDNAGNVSRYIEGKNDFVSLKFDETAPKINVSYDTNVCNEVNGSNYFATMREATVTITERPNSFNAENATNGIVIQALDVNGNVPVDEDGNAYVDKNGNALFDENGYVIDKDSFIGEWKLTENKENPDESTFEAKIKYEIDANYTFDISYTDNASNANTTVVYADNTVASNKFTVDKTNPTATVSVSTNIWNKLLSALTFGLWSNDTVTVTADAEDITSPVHIQYYKTDGIALLSEAELEAVTSWNDYVGPIEVANDERLTVYLKVTDDTGNYIYINSDGYIVDKSESTITLTPEDANENGIYNDDVEILVSVNDKKENSDYYSGIKKVEYWVEADGIETQREVLYSFEYVRAEGVNSNGGTLTIKEKGETDIVKENVVPTKDDLKAEFNETIVVDSVKNNCCDVKVFVLVTDNAGNVSNSQLALDIDSTVPTIDVTYDNNAANKVIDERGYFPAERVATVVITERPEHFDETIATNGIVIQALDVNGNVPVDEDGNAYVDKNGNALFDENGYVIDKDSFIGEWKLTENKENPDESTFEAKIKYEIDANYTFDISYTDNASNANAPVVYAANTKAPNAFTIDKINPVATISIESNVWDILLGTLTFGLWSNDTVTVTADAEDITSPVHIQYYKTDSIALLSEAELEAVTSWEDYSGQLDIQSDERLTVYLKVTDDAGNYIYINSDGYIVDKSESAITLTPEDANANGIYNGDVEVLISVNDENNNNDHYSGIKKVEYWVEADGVETQREVLYSFEYIRAQGVNNNGGTLTIKEKGKTDVVKENAVPTKDDLKKEYSQTITVDSVKNNSSDVMVFVEVTDNAGNVLRNQVALDIDIIAPVIDVTFDNNNAYKVVDAHGYFPAERVATVVITERANHFDKANATNGIRIVATDVSGKIVIEDCTSIISEWETIEDTQNPDNSKHIATITFDADAKYEFSVEYTDLADNESSSVITEGCTTPYSFTVDKTAPTGTVTVGELGTWDKLIEFLTFGLWNKDTVEVSQTNSDNTSGIESVSYYKTTATEALKKEQLMAIDDESWIAFDDAFEVSANEQFTVYVRIVDNSGNTTFISTDGIIVDNVKPEFIPSLEDTKPEIILATVENDVNGIYNSDVTVAAKVKDPVIGDTYSGLKEIRYEITNMGEKTDEGVLYSFGEKMPTKDKLIQIWENKAAIKVDSTKNNSNNVVVKVFAVDNAGNENEVKLDLKIDTTAPKIDVSYDNNDGDTTFKESTYFKKNRVATIVVTERNFNPEDVEVIIKNTHGADKVPVISKWTTVVADGNGDKTTHTATITYKTDGDYTFGISYVDLAGNGNKKVNYGKSLAPTKFSIDKTVPTFTVIYDNNDAANGNYYKAQRVATIVVKEHNFETSRVDIKLSATDNGVESANPTVSKWVSKGDIHTATIIYAADSKYTFDFDYTDKAGNKTANIEQQEFYVDKTNPVVSITGIVDNSANNDKEIGFVLSATDTNFDSFAPEVNVTYIDGNSVKADVGGVSDIANGKSYVVKNIEADGIYRVTCTVVDKAGNAFTQVTLQREDGSTYVENRSGNDTLITFSVNRDGSTFELNKSTAKVVNNYYVQSVDEDVVITEINVDELIGFKVTLNDKELIQNKDYTVTQSGGNGSWRKYTYSIKKALFEKEGEYVIVVSSKDAAGNDAFSDIKDATVNFVVDKTPPRVTVSGLASGNDYKVEIQTVTIIPTDDGGALKSLVILLVDEDGNKIKTLFSRSDDELAKVLEQGDGKIDFKIGEGVDQYVRIICTDKSVGANGETNKYDETFTDIDISQSAWKLFWSEPVLRWGSIAGVISVTGLIIFFVFKKKKKDEDEQK